MPHKKITSEGVRFPIQPSHIRIADRHNHFWGAFDDMDTERSAYFIVVLCREMGGWVPFNQRQIDNVHARHSSSPYHFGGLVTKGWIVIDRGIHHVTDDFVYRCFRVSPEDGTRHLLDSLSPAG